jgi:hypothetical protein
VTERTPWNRRTKPLPEPHLARLQKAMGRGRSLEEAGEAVGLTLPLAKSVFIRSGLPVPKPMRRRPDLAGPVDPDLGRRLHDHLRRVDSATVPEVAQALGVTAGEVRAGVWEEDRHRLLPSLTQREHYPDSAIVIGLQLMSFDRGRKIYARGPVPVSAAYWDEHRDPLAHPPASEVRSRFGTWHAACRAAGIPLRNHSKPLGPDRRWTDDDILASLRTFFTAGVGDTSTAFQEWTSTRPDAPSLGTVLTRLGRWTEVRARILG